jgi:hypothetical protein
LLQRNTAESEEPSAAEDSEKPQVEYDPFLHGSRSERRSALRRRGTQVAVLLKDDVEKGSPRNGWILDRSPCGLGMLVEEPISVGVIVSVRAAHATSVIPWVDVEVRNCREDRYGWIVGCEFVKTPPTAVLWQFG